MVTPSLPLVSFCSPLRTWVPSDGSGPQFCPKDPRYTSPVSRVSIPRVFFGDPRWFLTDADDSLPSLRSILVLFFVPVFFFDSHADCFIFFRWFFFVGPSGQAIECSSPPFDGFDSICLLSRIFRFVNLTRLSFFLRLFFLHLGRRSK